MESPSEIRKIAFLGDYLPPECGIATFTSDVLPAVAAEHPESQCFAVPVNDLPGGYEYPGVVRFEIEEQNLSSYQRAADFLNISSADIVCVQHEFGINDGPAGSHLLALLRELWMAAGAGVPWRTRMVVQMMSHSRNSSTPAAVAGVDRGVDAGGSDRMV